MGARQSKRSVDITTTPKKGEGEVIAVGEEKIEKLGDADVKAVVTNGTAAHTDIEFADKDEEAKEAEEKPAKVDVEIKENGHPESSDGEKTPEEVTAAGDQTPKVEDEKAVETAATENGEKVAAETPETKKQKEKKKKKWSLRSISFSKKDKSKPSKDKEKNGEVNEEKTEEATSPIAEEAKAEEEVKPTTEEAKTPVTNGDASKEELADKIPETIPEAEKEEVKKIEEPAVASSPAVETPKEEPKQAPEPSADKQEIEEPKPAAVVAEAEPVEEITAKEVRSEEVPPPLPSSNPPSQVTVFAESTKADVLSAEEKSLVVETPAVTSPAGLEEGEIATATETEATPTPPLPSATEEVEEPVVESSEPRSTQSSPLIVESLETTNQLDAKENEIIEETSKVEDSKESIPMVEEKEELVSSSADVPNEIVNEPSEESKDTTNNVLQESKSDLESNVETTVPEAKLNGSDEEKPQEPSKVGSEENGPQAKEQEQQSVVNNGDDSLPDLSSESLPSLPEPTDSHLEPMSLPPLDFVPEPLVLDDSLLSPPPAPPTPECERGESVVVPLTNGNAASAATNGVHHEDDDATPPPPPSLDGPLKQIPSAETKIGDLCEKSQTSGDAPAESVEPAPTATE